MTTQQTERELFEIYFETRAYLIERDETSPNRYKNLTINDDWEWFQEIRSPLLSRIAELEAENKQQGEVLDAARKDAERYRWLREHSREPDDGLPYAVISEYRDDLGLCQHHICFEEKLDKAIDAALISQKVEG